MKFINTSIFEALKRQDRAFTDFSVEVFPETLDAAVALTAPAESLLYQGGYSTIESVGGIAS